jgi:hypothetical protein
VFNFSTPSPLTDLVGKKVCFLLNPISNPLYCKYLLSILSILLRNSETSITIVLSKGTDFEFERKRIMVGVGVMKNKQFNRFIELITDEWPEQLTIINLDGSHFDNTFNLKLSKVKSVSSLKDYPEFGGRLGRSIHSALASNYAKSSDLFKENFLLIRVHIAHLVINCLDSKDSRTNARLTSAAKTLFIKAFHPSTVIEKHTRNTWPRIHILESVPF